MTKVVKVRMLTHGGSAALKRHGSPDRTCDFNSVEADRSRRSRFQRCRVDGLGGDWQAEPPAPPRHAKQLETGARRRATGQRGYALLTVFLMAALISFYLYAQLPRVAFESERDKEQTLIDRGEQYKRAIQLYVTAVKKFPAKIEDLENTNDKRYLRRRYIDPYTGKDEWRLIHVNAGGQLTDSLVQKPPAAPGANGQMTGGPLSSGTSTRRSECDGYNYNCREWNGGGERSERRECGGAEASKRRCRAGVHAAGRGRSE